MKPETRDALMDAWQYCDIEDKSTEFMIQFMQDRAKVNLDCVISFMEKTSFEDRQDWDKKQSALFEEETQQKWDQIVQESELGEVPLINWLRGNYYPPEKKEQG